MWLKSALKKYYNIHKEDNKNYKKDKTVDDLLYRIIQSDFADWYNRQYVYTGYYKHAPSIALLKIDFENNKVVAIIKIKFYNHKSSNIHKLYEYLCTEKEYHTKLNDVFYDVTAKYIDEYSIQIEFFYNKDEILKK